MTKGAVSGEERESVPEATLTMAQQTEKGKASAQFPRR